MRTIRSWLLFFKERQEQIAHSHSLKRASLSEIAKSDLPTLENRRNLTADQENMKVMWGRWIGSDLIHLPQLFS